MKVWHNKPEILADSENSLFKNQLTLLLAGWAFSRFILSPFRDIEIGDFVLEPGVFAATIMPFFLLQECRGHTGARTINMVLSGIIADTLLYGLMREGNDISAAVAAPFDPVIWAGSIGLLLMFMAIFVTFGTGNHAQGDNNTRLSPFTLIISCIATVVFFRVIYLLTIDVPNEGRSLIIAGVEVHHFAIGAFLLVGLVISRLWTRTLSPFWRHVLPGVAVGMILDQTVYMSLLEISDLSYNSPASWWGAVVLTAAFCIAAYGMSAGQRGNATS